MRGIPGKLYVDNGPSFRSNHLEHICASLGIVLVHARPYQPEGKGKIERWFRTVRGGFLCAQKTATIEELNEKFRTWVTDYNDTRHSSTGESPIRRFAKNIECVRPAPKDLGDHFRKTAKRTVAKDRTIALAGRLYEAPVELIGKQVSLLYHEHDPARVEVVFAGKTYGFISSRVEDMLKGQAVVGIKERFLYAVHIGAIAVITGDVGSGKSSALRFASSTLSRRSIAYFTLPPHQAP